jgi:DNA-binding NarL/FixJ family response regulator
MTTILLIEDNASFRKNIAQILTIEGFEVITAEDGRAGLERVREHLPNLIICDIMMPLIGGYDVLAKLRADATTASVPFIFLTAKGEMHDLRHGMSLGADDYLAKPVDSVELLEAVRTRLERHAQQRRTFAPCFDDARPLIKLGISEREAEILLWVAQGKSNSDIATICEISVGTVKKHTNHIFEKLGVEGRTSATLRALEVLAERDRHVATT